MVRTIYTVLMKVHLFVVIYITINLHIKEPNRQLLATKCDPIDLFIYLLLTI